MAINRFFKPVDYEYTPIPFQELVTLGKYYADERKQAEKDLANYIKSANEFTSLISKDVDTYNKTAFNDQIKSYINQAASNPSVMKDMGWRSGLQAAMNAVDYGMLNKLKSSAESAKTYNTAVQKLAMEGKMPPGWEPNYFDTYSTADSGVFNATPLAYETTVETIRPYVDNLKASYLYTQGGYDYFGVDEATVARQIDMFKSDILSNPINQRKMRQWMDAGATAEEAMNTMLQQAYTAGLEATHKTREINPFAKINAQVDAAAKKAGLGGGNTPKNAVWFTQSMTADATLRQRNVAEQIVSSMPEYKELNAAIVAASKSDATKEQKEAGKKAEEQLKIMRDEITPYMAQAYVFNKFAGEPDSNKKYTAEQLNAGTWGIINQFGANVGSKYHDKLNGTIRGVSNKVQNTDVGKTYVVSGPTDLTLASYFVGNGLIGYEFDENGAISRINEALQSGKFGEMPIVGDGYVMGLPNGNNSNNYHGTAVAISQQSVNELFKNEELTNEQIDDIMKMAGASVSFTRKSESTSETERPRVSWDDDVQYLTTTTTHVRGGDKYYILPVVHSLPSTGGGIEAETLNNIIAEEQYSDSQRGNLQMYNWLLSNL